MVVAAEVGIESPIECPLDSGFDAAFGHDVLIEPKLATRSNYAAKLPQSTILVANRTEDQRDNSNVEGFVFCGQIFGEPVNNMDMGRRGFRLCLTKLPQSRLRLNGNNLGNRARIVAKVLPVAGPHFNHPASDAAK